MLKDTTKLAAEQYNYLKKSLKLDQGFNAEISTVWYLMALRTKHTDVIPFVEAFLGVNGRLKFIQPLYSALYKLNKEEALTTFNKYKSIYHPIAVKLIQADFKKNSFLTLQ